MRRSFEALDGVDSGNLPGVPSLFEAVYCIRSLPIVQ